jgi:hypothetical protein
MPLSAPALACAPALAPALARSGGLLRSWRQGHITEFTGGGILSCHSKIIQQPFIDPFGLHRFDIGKWITGLLYLLTGGLLLLG